MDAFEEEQVYNMGMGRMLYDIEEYGVNMGLFV